MSSKFTFTYISQIIICACTLILFSCTKAEEPLCCDEEQNTDNSAFDRQALLTSWADDIIIPSFERYVESLDNLQKAALTLQESPDDSSFKLTQEAWLDAYTKWQTVSMFDIGKAEAIGLRNFTNIFPTDTDKIKAAMSSGDLNLELPSNFVVQGFPALDYLLFAYPYGLDGSGNAHALKSKSYRSYVFNLTERLYKLSHEVLSDWKGVYRAEFITNDASSATGSVDKLVNDALFYYEKFLRAGKIGIPAGVFSGSPISNAVEAPYSRNYSKLFFETGLTAFQHFLNGQTLDGRISDVSIGTYLEAVGAVQNGTPLMTLINNQLDKARASSDDLAENLKDQIESDNIKMLETYDELQKAVVLLKVDMLQALNIKVDFVDADGD